MIKKILSVFVILVLTMFLVGCSNDPTPIKNNDDLSNTYCELSCNEVVYSINN